VDPSTEIGSKSRQNKRINRQPGRAGGWGSRGGSSDGEGGKTHWGKKKTPAKPPQGLGFDANHPSLLFFFTRGPWLKGGLEKCSRPGKKGWKARKRTRAGKLSPPNEVKPNFCDLEEIQW